MTQHKQPLQDSSQRAKEAAALAALKYVQEGMLIGLGTGSTAYFFITALADLCRQGLSVKALATSQKSASLAREQGIELLDAASTTQLDLTVDGADQVDSRLNVVKGAGGALLREKIVASMSKDYIIIVDESKMAARLGPVALPVETAPFGIGATLFALRQRGWQAALRRQQDNTLYVSDNGNYIIDIDIAEAIEDLSALDSALRQIPGVLQTGLFLAMADKVIIGDSRGAARTINRQTP